jgi:hypothetical protein
MLDNFAADRRVDLSSTAKEAADASERFCEYVRSLSGLESRGPELILAAAPVLIDVGEKLWTFFADRSAQERETLANVLRPQITWKSWAHLTDL